MSDPTDPLQPRPPAGRPSEPPGETFGERLRRRREALAEGGGDEPRSTWRSRARTLVALVVDSPHAAASIARRNADAARAAAGVEAVIFAGDLPPFRNTLGTDYSGEPLLAEEEVHYRGQPVAVVVARDESSCREAAALLEIDYHVSPGVLSVEQALAMKSFHGETRSCSRGDVAKALAAAPRTLQGAFAISPQEACLDRPLEVTVKPGDGVLSVRAPALLPTSVRTAAAKASGLPESAVHLEEVSLPGASSALETEPVRLAMLAVHAALKCRCAVTLRLSDEHSPLSRGRRHEALAFYEAGYDDEGRITAADLRIALAGGPFAADSPTVLDRAVLHADSVYAVPHLRISAQLCRTNHLPSSSLAAEGAAQGAWIMEEIVRCVAGETGLPPETVRERNFHPPTGESASAPCGQPVSPAAIRRVWDRALESSGLERRRRELAEWNRKHPGCKRGLGAVAVKFGVGDPRPDRNAAAALVQILADGSVIARAGLVDLHDGLSERIRDEVAARLGIEPASVRVILNDFDSLPRCAPALGADAAGLVLRALDDACAKLLKRLRETALQLFASRGRSEMEMESIRFSGGLVGPEALQTGRLHFEEVVEGACRRRVNLIETGYHRSPNLWWDPELGAGWPFSSFTYAAAVAEVQIDAFTGEVQVLRVDAAHEASAGRTAERDFAQVVRAFQLGTGWVLSEPAPDLEADDEAGFSPEEGVPGFADAPFEFHAEGVAFPRDSAPAPGDPCMEAPVLLAAAVREAVGDAVAALAPGARVRSEIPLPATPPRVIGCLREVGRQLRGSQEQ